MSFILDALRRAEAERARGTVPGLHTPSVADLLPAAADGRRGAGSPRRPWGLAAAALGALALTAGGAWWLGRGSVDGAPSPVPPLAGPAPLAGAAPSAGMGPAEGPGGAAGPGPVAGPAPGAVPGWSPATTAPGAPPAGLPEPTAPVPRAAGAGGGVAQTQAPALRRPGQTPAEAERPSPPPARPRAQAALPAPAPTTAEPTPAATAPPGVRPTDGIPGAVPWLADLPDLRAQLPALAIAGGMYSDQADQRLVIVNGQVAREGELVAPGVRLEQIRPRSAVFSAQGRRFAVPM